MVRQKQVSSQHNLFPMRLDTFQSRIASYSALSYALLLVGKFSEAQIVYTDVMEDDTLQDNEIYLLDLNNDGLADFKFRCNSFFNNGSYNNSHGFIADGNNYNQNQMEGILFGGFSPRVYVLNQNDTISSGKSWLENSHVELLYFKEWNDWHDGSSSGTVSIGYWKNKVNRYVGLKLMEGADTLYGWARLDVLNYKFVIVKDYAYDSIPNEPIHAGDTGGFPVSAQTSVLEREFTIFPNPATNSIRLYLPECKPSRITIYNILGEEILKQQVVFSTQYPDEINISSLTPGANWVTVMDADNVLISRFIKQ